MPPKLKITITGNICEPLAVPIGAVKGAAANGCAHAPVFGTN